MANSEWIITPGLYRVVADFIRQYEYLKGKQGRKVPIMILGDRGVGKSLFVHIYETLYKKDNLNPKIVRLNTASLMDTLVDSELFGHKKGAFTGADRDKEGLVEKADLLILEEIGDIPHYVQAKLLTFLEDRKFRRLGDTEEKKTEKDLQVIATTNKEQKDMRPDFYDRFIKITVPPLCNRRIDILYYIGCFFPDLLKHLHPWEILTLLAYPWPGNVREIQAVCLDIELLHLKVEEINGYFETSDSIPYVKKENTGLNFRACPEHYEKLKKAGIDVNFLEKVLNKHGLGLDWNNKKKPFAKFKECPLSKEGGTWNSVFETKALEIVLKECPLFFGRGTWDSVFETKTLENVKEFDSARVGLRLYCRLFHKEWLSSDDFLSSSTSIKQLTYHRFASFPHRTYIAGRTHKHEELAKDILEYVFKIRIPKDLKEKSLLSMDMPEEKGEYEEWLSQVLAAVPNESNLNEAMSDAKEQSESPFELKESDLLRAYYLYHKDKGLKVSEAARATGNKDSSFRDKLKKLSVTPWR